MSFMVKLIRNPKLFRFVRKCKLKTVSFKMMSTSTDPSKHTASRETNILRAVAIMIAGYAIGSYLEFKKVIPKFPYTVAAANSLSGRRERFNFISNIVGPATSSVVYIEVNDTRKRSKKSGKKKPISKGSGCIVESDGLILTNAHVVVDKIYNPNIEIRVKLSDGRSFYGIVETLDRSSDLATVRIKGRNLPVMRLGSSSGLKSGKWVIALGSPLSLYNTVTCGIISAYRKSEEIGLTKKPMYYIQTDASINDGNCGGPLLNLKGETIGINSMKILPGISFAIPADYVREFLNETQNRKLTRTTESIIEGRYIGVTMLTLTEDIIVELQNRGKLPEVSNGVLLCKVIADSPAME